MDTNIDYRLSNAINMATEQNKITSTACCRSKRTTPGA